MGQDKDCTIVNDSEEKREKPVTKFNIPFHLHLQ